MTDSYTRVQGGEKKVVKTREEEFRGEGYQIDEWKPWEKTSRMSGGYIQFTRRHKTFWIWFNILLIVVSCAMCFGSVEIMNMEEHAHDPNYGKEEGDEYVEPTVKRSSGVREFPLECNGVKLAIWGFFGLHVVNFLFNMMCLCGLEKRWCATQGLIGVALCDVIVLIWAQVTYFQSQQYNCIDTTPKIYFWLMGEIMFFYIVSAFVICYFFRQFCQDPSTRDELLKETDLEGLARDSTFEAPKEHSNSIAHGEPEVGPPVTSTNN